MTVHGLQVLYPDTEWPDFQFSHLRVWDCFVYWRDIHLGPGLFDFSRSDMIIEKARKAGVTNITYCLAMTPQWAASAEYTNHAPWLNPGCNTPPAEMQHWDEFVTAMVSRYQGRVGSWQIWNEPQLRWFWTGSWPQLAQMTSRAKRIINRIDPNAKIVAAPVLPLLGDGGASYYRSLRDARWPVDIYAAHSYAGNGTDVGDFEFVVQQWKRRLIKSAYRPGPLWVTETNCNHMRGPIAEPLIGPWMRGVGKVADKHGVSRVYWYAAGQHSDKNLLGIPFYTGTKGNEVLAKLAAPK